MCRRWLPYGLKHHVNETKFQNDTFDLSVLLVLTLTRIKLDIQVFSELQNDLESLNIRTLFRFAAIAYITIILAVSLFAANITKKGEYFV